MNPEVFSLVAAWMRFSRGDWCALARVLGVTGLVFISFALSGCVVAAKPRGLVVKPAPVVVVTEPPRHAEKVILIREAPPPVRHEVVIERERPSAAHVWIAGHWRHDGHAYVWVPGHWDRPPRTRAVWVEPRWERRDGVYVFIEGVWR